MRLRIRSLALVLAGMLAASRGAPAATISETDNVDDPLHHPYQVTKACEIVSQSALCGFPPAPSGKRVRITNVSCLFSVSDAGGARWGRVAQ